MVDTRGRTPLRSFQEPVWNAAEALPWGLLALGKVTVRY